MPRPIITISINLGSATCYSGVAQRSNRYLTWSRKPWERRGAKNNWPFNVLTTSDLLGVGNVDGASGHDCQ